MSNPKSNPKNPSKAPRDIVEGGPERLPNGQDTTDEPGQSGSDAGAPGRGAPKHADAPEHDHPDEGKQAPHGGDVPDWYQPESGQPGTR